MFLDARTLPSGTAIETDICVVGAGAAGISIARELSGQPHRIALIESGGFEPEEPTQQLYDGRSIGRDYQPLDAVRLRYFGGTTNHWAGNCWPLSPIDFEPRPWIEFSGWPFNRSALDPFYRRAQDVCELGRFDYEPEPWAAQRGIAGPDFDPALLVHRISQASPPTRFGPRYRRDLEQAPNVTTYLHANAVAFIRQSGTVAEARFATLTGRHFTVSARAFVLACGGLENPRLLLSSTGQGYERGLGNEFDLAGRFFMDHAHIVAALALLNEPATIAFYGEAETDPPTSGHTALAPATQRRLETANPQFRIAGRSPSPGINALSGLARDARSGRWPDRFGQRLRRVLGDVDGVVRELGHRGFGAGAVPRDVIAIAEQTPNPDSRVTLGPDCDPLGMRRIRLDWRANAQDKRSVRVAMQLFGQELGRLGLGRLRIDLDPDDTAWTERSWPGPHHMGTTRMHDDPRRGVVDRDCRVFGTENFYVAGSSVFPTSGSANPTLTVVALALRLADHLDRVLRR